VTVTTQHAHPQTLSARVRQLTGLNPAKCYQCGKCSAGCPMAEELALKPHDILRMIQQRKDDRLFRDPSMWMCLTCETCTARCPNDVDPARIIDGLREIALQDDKTEPPKTVRAFHDSFLKQIRRTGRVSEFAMILGFKLHGGPLFADVMQAPKMMKRGKLALRAHKIRGVKDVQRIFDACESKPEVHE
jgi:heterodisulfide reductase subunit C2